MYLALVRWKHDTHAVVGGKMVQRGPLDEDVLPLLEAHNLAACGVVELVGDPWAEGRVGRPDKPAAGAPPAPEPQPYLRCPACGVSIDPAALDVPLQCEACGAWYVQVQTTPGKFAVAPTPAPPQEGS
jgi:hypothetical protein